MSHQQNLYHVFIVLKKAFGMIWHDALSTTMRKYNINATSYELLEICMAMPRVQFCSMASSELHLESDKGVYTLAIPL